MLQLTRRMKTQGYNSELKLVHKSPQLREIAVAMRNKQVMRMKSAKTHALIHVGSKYTTKRYHSDGVWPSGGVLEKEAKAGNL